MNKLFLLSLLLFSSIIHSQTEPFEYDLDWCSYFYCVNDETFLITSTAIDENENIYVTGRASQSCGFIPNINPIYEYHGMADAFIAKFLPSGELEWFKYYGGNNDEIANNIKIYNNHIYIGGRIYSTDNEMNFSNNYTGNGDAYVSKLTIDGEVLWSTYIGGEDTEFVSTLDVNQEGDVFMVGSTRSLTGLATPNTFQTVNLSQGIHQTGFIAKVDGQGNKVWATYYGEHNNGYVRSMTLGESGVYLMGIDISHQAGNYYGTPGSFKESTGIDVDNFVAKFSFEGDRLWGTYFGGSDNESSIGTQNIISLNDKIYFCGYTGSATGIATPGSQQETLNGAGSMFLIAMDEEGNRLWGTYAGTFESNNPGSTISTFLNIDILGNLYLSGTTNLSGIGTPGSYKESITLGDHDAFVRKYNIQGQLLWGTYFGLENFDGGYQAQVDNDYFIISGYTANQNLATLDAFQEDYNTNISNSNQFISRFEIPTLGLSEQYVGSFSVYPNPTSAFININSANKISDVFVYDIVGKLVLSKSINHQTEVRINIENLSKGTYIIKIRDEKSFNLEKFIKF